MATKSYWQRLQRERISRRRLLGAAMGSTAGLAVIAVFGHDGAQAAPDGAPRSLGVPTRGGRYTFSIAGDFGTIDPVTSVAFGPVILPRMYNTLIERSRRRPDFFFFDLAESLEQPDEETYNYTIRSGVRIAPNDLGIPERDLDAFDARAWLERITQDDRAVHRAFANQWLQSFEAPNAQTFQIKTNGPYAYFLLRLGAPLGGCIPPREFFEQGIGLENQGVGAGPFVLRPGTFREGGDALLDRNPNYYRADEMTGAQLPYVDEVEVVRISDRTPRRIAFVDQQIHEYDPETIAEVEDLQIHFPDLQVFEEPAFTFISLTMNPTRPPWNDERLRKAALFALNRQEFVDIIVGGAGRPNGLIHWPLGNFALPPEELEALQPYDPEESRRLIREATGEDTITIKLIYPASSNIQFHNLHLPIFLRQMREAGFNIQEDALLFTSWLHNYQKVNYDASLSLNQIYEIPEIPIDFHASRGPQGDGNFAIGIGALFPEIDAAITESKNTTDPDELIAKVRDVQRMLYARGPAFLPIMSWTDFVVRHGFIKNWPRDLGTTQRYLNTWWLEDAAIAKPAVTATPPATPFATPLATASATSTVAPIAPPSTGAGSDGSGGGSPTRLAAALAGAGVAAAAGYGALRRRPSRSHRPE